MDNKEKIKSVFNTFIKQHKLDIKLSFLVPKNYETSYGTFDVCKKTLYYNIEYLKQKPECELMYYLFHELRHAMQYIYPQKFSSKIRNSLSYVIMYDGTCYKLVNNKWKTCKINLDSYAFVELYKSLPYELDANDFAYKQTIKMFDSIDEIQPIYKRFLPTVQVEYKDLKKVFKKVDDAINI